MLGVKQVLCTGCLALMLAGSLAGGASAQDGHTVVDEQARFQVLTPRVIRMEYAPNGDFEDRSTFNVVDRSFASPSFTTEVDGPWREIQTDELLLRYRRGSGPFREDNLIVRRHASEPQFEARPFQASDVRCRPGTACEAERASLSGGAVVNANHGGFTGDGFVAGYWNEGATTRWRIEQVPNKGTYALGIRYANAKGGTRTLTLIVNGEPAGKVRFEAHSAWNDWTTVTENVSLKEGTNTVALACRPQDGCNVNLDYLALVPAGDSLPAPEEADASSNLGGWRRSLDGARGPQQMKDGLLSRKGWYLIDDSDTPIWPSDSAWVTPRQRDSTYQDAYFFGYGRDYRAALHDFKRLAGPAPLLPRWAFGIWFSRWYAYSAEDYREQVIPNFRAEDVPLDVLVIDTDFKAPNRWVGWNWDRDLFPGPKRFLRWTEEQGLKVTLNVHPGIVTYDPEFPEAQRLANGTLIRSETRDSAYVWDWARPSHARSYFELHAPFEEDGADFWWIDWCCGDSRVSMPGLTADSWINHLYAERMRRQGKRGFAFSRIASAYEGYGTTQVGGSGPWAAHRHALHFTGDTHATWDMLDFEIAFTVQEGNIGVPYVSHDIGSFHAGSSDDNALPPPLYVRWVQFGTFQPIFRLHAHHGERLPWHFEQPVRDIAARFMRLRERLVPYLYTLAREAHDTGLPMARGTYLHYPEHEAAYQHDGQYLLGDQVLVASVADSSGQKTVWFPPGQWTDFFTGTTYEGPHRDTLRVPLGRMPVFVKAGGIVPLQPEMDHVGQRPVDPLTLRVYAGADGAFRLYEDAGEGHSYQRGARAWTPVRYEDAEQTLTIGGASETYPGQPEQRGYRVEVIGVERPQRVQVSGQTLESTSWQYEEDRETLVVRIEHQSTREGIRLSFAE